MSTARHARRGFVALHAVTLIAGVAHCQAPTAPRAQAPAAAELARLEGTVRASTGAGERGKAAQAYKAAVARAGDLVATFPLGALESELVRVIGIEKSMRAGPCRPLVGHHVVLLAPERWLEALGAAGRAEAVATLDTAHVLLEDLTGCDLARARGRRLLIVFTPDHPRKSAQTLEAVVWVGMDYLTVPPPYQVLFHEMGHELFPPWNLRPRHDTFNEMWPELGREYVSWCLGMRDEAEAARTRFLAAYRDRFLGHGLPLEQLGPYDIGAGMLQSVLDQALRKDGEYDWEPLRRFFRSVLTLPETESFGQKQETLAFLMIQALGPRAGPPLEQAGFVLRPERQALLPREIAGAAPLLAAVRQALERGDEPAAGKPLARLAAEFPGSPWTAGARMALAAWLAARERRDEALAQLRRAGHVAHWVVLGPFPNPSGAGLRTGHPPETRIDLDRGCDLEGKTLRWQPVGPSPSNGYVDLDPLFTPNDEVLAYAFVEIPSDRPRKAALWTGSDDAIAAWVNGVEVVRRELPRGCYPDNERTPITLRQGRNALLLKVGDHRGGWGFTCRVTDENDVPLAGN